VSAVTGLPLSVMDWLNFPEKHIAEAKFAYARFCPGERAIRIRSLKAASIFISALQVHAEQAGDTWQGVNPAASA
jgi:hypothetical protein